MQLIRRVKNVSRGLLHRYAPASVKRAQWNREYERGWWKGLESSPGDPVYDFVAKYAAGGTVLDLGCGNGSTALEISSGSYSEYVGVDISDAALERARVRSREAGLSAKQSFAQGDFESFTPSRTFSVILFRDSLYYAPASRVPGIIRRYATHLAPGGVFVIRLYIAAPPKAQELLRTLRRETIEIETYEFGHEPSVIFVARPRATASTASIEPSR